ncbi:unnamed protein product [Euphydryas editha]|uniref:Uncharacterized protein n=1 Tax=Euphydryas editha TaxID=104508 RepID=A0AAU9VBH9_EUPED|nr:unnamed protein product [Euphydryas editha]
MASVTIIDTPKINKIEEKETKNKTKTNVIKEMKTKQNIRQLNNKQQNDFGDSTYHAQHDDTSLTSSDDDINLSELKKRNTSISQDDKSYCVVCSRHYAKGKEEWYQCKICGGWTHESCGHKGGINVFCQQCF